MKELLLTLIGVNLRWLHVKEEHLNTNKYPGANSLSKYLSKIKKDQGRMNDLIEEG